MLLLPRSRQVAAVFGITLALASSVYTYARLHRPPVIIDSADVLLEHADALSWNSRWGEAKPFYEKAAFLFAAQHRPRKALYATVSEIPADESKSLPGTIWQLTQLLTKPDAQDPETRLRILTIRGMLEINYDASEAQANWEEVGSRALKLRHF